MLQSLYNNLCGANWIAIKIYSDYSEHREDPNIFLNITGWFKGAIPFLTFFAQLYKIPIYYKYENSAELVKIPYFPIDIDYQLYMDYWDALNFLYPKEGSQPIKDFQYYLNDNDPDAYKELARKKLIGVDEKNQQITKTVLGKILHKKFSEMLEGKEYNPYAMIGNLMELKIYKYFVNMYKDNKDVKVYHSTKFIENKLKKAEADVLIDDTQNKIVTVIEVKPGDNDCFIDDIKIFYKERIPFYNNEYTEEKGYKRKYKVCLYSEREDLPIRVLDEVKNFMTDSDYNGENCAEWLHLIPPKNYRKNVDWDVEYEKKGTKITRLKKLVLDPTTNKIISKEVKNV